ncbi:BgTH12-01166 [Blumeria graminis f. sp. triticale]|uniref:Bgt-221 n=3 Tax=Blumeria graminis TaxID=34373 RepID=A0A061HI98_BLUGR|nr:hypothetical protein BGT96224_221 [Blumeria graminis f. sp. tritici 96224]CAD6505676.1 BgTH12-01166 [Blumeria graminis f. sp. triticale]VDB93837.1 Bgt-221 [Blumeria graminis f. sp. tritici]
MSSPMIGWAPAFINMYRNLKISNFSTKPNTLPSVPIHETEIGSEKRIRTLRHLIRANHINHALFFNELKYHNHMSHILGSSYILGAGVNQLQKIYDEEAKLLVPWEESPCEITTTDWREFLGDKRYQRAFIDFYEDELALKFDYDWKNLVDEYMFCEKKPLINGVIAGLGHSLIHLGYAYELSCKELAIEALAEASVSYDFLHKYIDDPSYTKPSTNSSKCLLKLLNNIRQDNRLDDLINTSGFSNFDILFTKCEDIILEHWNSWSIENVVEQLQSSQDIAIALLMQTLHPGVHTYDFYIAHVLTTTHAIRVLLPLIPESFHVNLLRQWWLMTISVYIMQLRREINASTEIPTIEKSWSHVEQKALTGVWSTDAHYVKTIRAIKEAATTWGDPNQNYLAAAIKFADDFEGWRFGGEGE